MNLDDILNTPTLKQGSFKYLLEKNTDIKSFLEKENIDPIKGAAFFAGLLTQPDLQSNTLRLEALIHIILASCTGKRKLNPKNANKLFQLLNKTFYGYGEDPAEDVFISNIISDKGNFRIFEGIWESNTFTLQRFVDILNYTPDLELFNEIKISVYSLLKLSEEIANRANLKRYSVGNDYPLKTIPDHVLEKHYIFTDYIKFSYDELLKLDIQPEKLSPFIIEPELQNQILNEDLGGSILEAKPIAILNNVYYVLLPTSIGLAIKKYIISELDRNGYLESFEKFLALAYADYFRNIPLLGDLIKTPITFNKEKHYYFAEYVTEIDNGRYIHLIFFLDNFIGYHEDWINSVSPFSDEIGIKVISSITSIKNQFKSRSDFKEGLTLLVACGWGRIINAGFDYKNDSGWRIKHISDYDLSIISLMPRFSSQTLFRLFEAEDAIYSMSSNIMNINGILNLYSWAISNNYHLIPHESFNDNDGVFDHVLIDQNSLLESRQRVLNSYDEHVVEDKDGHFIHVKRKNIGNYFKEDDNRPIYVSVKDLKIKELVSLIEDENLDIWCSISVLDNDNRSMEYKIWEAVSKWISLLMPLLNKQKKINALKIIKWNLIFESLFFPEERILLSEDELVRMVDVTIEQKDCIISNFKAHFVYGFFIDTNICEKIIMQSFLEGFKKLNNESDFDYVCLLNSIMIDKFAKNIHTFTAKNFRDYVRDYLPEAIFIDKFDDSTSRIGLGWLARKPEEGNIINGIVECTKYIEILIDKLIEKLNGFYSKFKREDLILKLLLNHESIQSESVRWDNTSKSILSIQKDIQDCYDVISNEQFKYKGSSISTRLAIEVALSECPLNGGQEAGTLDLSKMIAYASCIHHLGGWSDAINYGLIEPVIKISSYGQILMNYNSLEEVVQPYGKALEYDNINKSSQNYAKLYQEQEFVESISDSFEKGFLDAWDSESGFRIDEGRRILDLLEDKGIDLKKAVYSIKYKELVEYLKSNTGFNKENILKFIERFKLLPRESWTSVPQGYRSKDIWLWKFKRRLSVISKPIIQIDDSDDPNLFITPALIRDGFMYLLRGCHSASFDEDYVNTSSMKSWIGAKNNYSGHEFNKIVANELIKLGWNARTDIKASELLNMKLDKDYGDIDVIAWNNQTNRILLIECKQLNLAKTYGEIAEQLYEFRGELDNKGKPDRLKKHLIRKDICFNYSEKIFKFTKLPSSSTIELHLVFSNVVPIVFSKSENLKNVKITIFDALRSI